MELREWLIILGLVLVAIIVFDGVRRLQRQRKVPRLDRAAVDDDNKVVDPEEAAKQAEINWELPNGGARVVREATQPTVQPKPKLQRQEHPGASKVFSRMNAAAKEERGSFSAAEQNQHGAGEPGAQPVSARESVAVGGRPSESGEQHNESERDPLSEGRFSRAGMAAALRSGGQRVSQSMQRMSSALQGHDEEHQHPHREPSLGVSSDGAASEPSSPTQRYDQSTRQTQADAPDTTFEPPFEPVGDTAESEAVTQSADPATNYHDDVVTPHPVVEKALRHHVSAQRARETLAHSDEIIVISVMARNEEGFSGPDLLKLMLACGLRYSEMGIFLRYETEEADSELQFAMVDVVKPGTFDLEAMDDFTTPGVTFLMPLPGARDSAAAFEAMFETAMVLVRNLGGELKDENRSVMTAQTIEFARQRVQEFERRNRLHRYQVN